MDKRLLEVLGNTRGQLKSQREVDENGNAFIVVRFPDGTEKLRIPVSTKQSKTKVTIKETTTTEVTVEEEPKQQWASFSLKDLRAMDDEVVSRDKKFNDWVDVRRKKQERRESLRPVNLIKSTIKFFGGNE